MGQIDEWLEKGRTKKDGTRLSDERLTEVFDLVKPKDNWKNPIDAWVDKAKADREEIELAVTWFAGGVPEVHDNGGGGVWYVYGAGYYEWIGA